MKTFEKLLLAAAYIEKMRQDITETTNTLLGMVDATKFEEAVFPSGENYFWKIQKVLRISRGEPQKSRLVVEFFSREGQVLGNLLYSTHPISKREPALEDVEDVYKGLEDLVNYLASYPQHCEKLAWLLETYDISMQQQEA